MRQGKIVGTWSWRAVTSPMQCQCQVGLHVQFFSTKRNNLTIKYGLLRLHAQNPVLYQTFSPGPSSFFFFSEEKLNTVMPRRIINSKLTSFKPLFAFSWLAQELKDSPDALSDDALRACGRIEMLLPECCWTVPQQIKLMVNAFAAMLSHHARADLPLGNKLDDRQKREAYAHRSLIDLFTAKVLPAKAHTFAKKILSGLIFCSSLISQSSLITPGVFKISTMSSDKAAFDQAAPVYNSALKASGYSESITFLENRKQAPTDIRRSKEIQKRDLV